MSWIRFKQDQDGKTFVDAIRIDTIIRVREARYGGCAIYTNTASTCVYVNETMDEVMAMIEESEKEEN